MSQSAHLAREQTPPLREDHVILLSDATWADFQRILELRGDRPVPRIAYLEGTLELMTPSRPHESLRRTLGCLIEAWCMEAGVEISPYGSWTLEDKAAERGVEPDECYVVGNDPDPITPDLAIEVVWTSGRLDKLDIYRKLGVREVWVWKNGALRVFVLREGTYEERGTSEVLPGLDVTQLASFVDVKPMTRAVREYRAALRLR